MMLAAYQIQQELVRDEWSILYRGRRREDNAPILLKTARHDPPRLVETALLTHEHELLQILTTPGIPQAYDSFSTDRESYLVLADPGGSPLQPLTCSRPLNLNAFFPLGLQLCAILAALHRQDFAHYHLTPWHILWRPETNGVTLIDFTLAAAAMDSTWEPLPLQALQRSLPYLSPEQTGRMNRTADYRADFYSLGVLFYELLTGVLPFETSDTLELIHAHLARSPRSPQEITATLPAPLSQIVMKLLAKSPDQRYQSALGLQHDLERCAQEWTARQSLTSFPLGQYDVSERFLLPQKLYGREQEREQLLAAFEHICTGTSALVLLSGSSGVGKTKLVQELSNSIIRQRGSFISGKFDQVTRDIPYGALIQALRGLIHQLLAEDEERLAHWRKRITQAVGANSGVLIEVIPELALILGPPPPLTPLDPAEAHNRFRRVFQNFIGALARKEHPLVVFLDDLQWADAATLQLLPALFSSLDIQSLLLIGAYRDNEVDAEHLLMHALRVLETAETTLHRLVLQPLTLAEVSALLTDALHDTPQEVLPLARLMVQKTDGNPFFLLQFLQTLHREKVLKFEPERRRWRVRFEALDQLAMADNVIDLMTRKIQLLSPRTQRALTLAACIGNQFDLQTLATVSQQPFDTTATDLAEAVEAGLLFPVSRSYHVLGVDAGAAIVTRYRFLHDRVQQAAHELIAPEQRQPLHLAIGRLLLASCDPTAVEEKLFDIVQHLNRGSASIVDEGERLSLARLNMRAGRKAKAATAYQTAVSFFTSGLALLAVEQWETDYDSLFSSHLDAAESLSLAGQFDEAERLFRLLLQHARAQVDRAQVYNLWIAQYENMSRYDEAVRIGREGLALFGVIFPETEEARHAALDAELTAIQALVGQRSIASLLDLPPMRDQAMQTVMKLLTTLWAPAYVADDKTLTRLIAATLVRLSLEHGHTEESAFGYVTYALTIGSVQGDYQTGHAFGELALRVNEFFNDEKRRAKIHHLFSCFVNPWRKPLTTCFPYAREARRSGLETGDFAYVTYGAFHESWYGFLTSQDLARFEQEYAPNISLLKNIRAASFVGAQQLILNWARALQGLTTHPLSLSDTDFQERYYQEAHKADAFFLTFFHIIRLHLHVIFADYENAFTIAREARKVAHALEGTIWPVLLDFLHGLTLAALAPGAAESDKAAYRGELRERSVALARLAEQCPDNFRCWALMLGAEEARIGDHPLTAMPIYEEAIRHAQATRNLGNEALAHELYGRFWRERGNDAIAALYLNNAHRCYTTWNATAKARALAKRYSDLIKTPEARAEPPAARTLPPLEKIADLQPPPSLDIATVTKAAHAIAGEMELADLLRALLRIAIENAGAQRGLFLQEYNSQLILEAEGEIGNGEVRVFQHTPLEQYAHLSRAVVYYVHKTGENVIVNDATLDQRFINDPYIQTTHPRSLLCTPVMHQGKFEGVLYLENNLTTDAFTVERVQVMEILSAQAAIALENARLYGEMKQEAHHRRQAEETLRTIAEGTATTIGRDFFHSLVRHVASTLEVRYAFITECVGQDKARAHLLAFWDGAQFTEGDEYDVEGTPCKRVYAGEICQYAENIQKLFPDDADLVELGAESYIGIPMHNAAGGVIGHLVVLDAKPLGDTSQWMPILRIFAARAGAELERQHAEEQVRAALTEVEDLKNRLHAENIYLQEEIRQEHNFEEIVGNSPALLNVLHKVELVAPTDATVLILGETGTGKELIARAIHDRSTRKDRPLVKMNCGAISAGLVESELFGHVKGAFTGAHERRTGRFELAHGGTLFLDEVGELPLETQVKLLRVLQEGEFEPVGSSRTMHVDVRVIAATNRQLEELIRTNRFRSDLFYRLNVFPIEIPPLRERQTDIPQLTLFFLSRFAKKFGKHCSTVAKETMELFSSYTWPGNIRELQNLVERAIVLSQGPVLTVAPHFLPQTQLSESPSLASTTPTTTPVARESTATRNNPIASPPLPLTSPHDALSLEEIERLHILKALAQTGWTIEGERGAAQRLNLRPSTLRSRMKKLGISRATHESHPRNIAG